MSNNIEMLPLDQSFKILANQSASGGYIAEFCVECSIKEFVFKSTNFKISQLPNMNEFVVAKDFPNQKALDYDQDFKFKKIGNGV